MEWLGSGEISQRWCGEGEERKMISDPMNRIEARDKRTSVNRPASNVITVYARKTFILKLNILVWIHWIGRNPSFLIILSAMAHVINEDVPKMATHSRSNSSSVHDDIQLTTSTIIA